MQEPEGSFLIMEIKDLVKNRYVEFAFYRSGFFYYNIIVINTPENHHDLAKKEIFQFSVPLEDVGNATLLLHDKALTFMRWIRKAKEENTLIKITK
jgi:hypothetical protein